MSVNIGFYSSAAVRKEIADETDRETGRSKAISGVPIHLSIYSPEGEAQLCFYCALFCILNVLRCLYSFTRLQGFIARKKIWPCFYKMKVIINVKITTITDREKFVFLLLPLNLRGSC